MKEPLENFDYNDEPTYSGISKATAKNLADRYKNECQPLLSAKIPDKTNNLDARSIVFPIETLKKFIWEIENKVRDIADTGELGIRLYYAKYPDIAAVKANPKDPLYKDLHNLPDPFSFHHTLFMVPTYKGDNGIDIDFDPWQAAANGTLSPLDPLTDTTPSGQDLMTPQMNHGNISPPPFLSSDDEARNHGMSF
jgi:hypothetical protein